MSIFSKLFGGNKEQAESVAEQFNKLPDEHKTIIVEVAKTYQPPAPVPTPDPTPEPAPAVTDKGKEEPPTDNNVAPATSDTKPLEQEKKAEVTKMTETGKQEVAPVVQPPVTPPPAPQPNPMPETPKVEYASKQDLSAFQKALEDSNKLIADQAAIIAKQNADMTAMRKDLDDQKTQYSRFVNPAKEFDVKPDLGVAHVSGTRQTYKDIAAKTFKGGH